MAYNRKSTEYLKECIGDALIGLMKEKPIEKISAQEIAAAAGVGRATYFRHFSSKNQALTFKIVKLWERWAREHALSHPDQFILENVVQLYRFNLSIQPLLELVYAQGCQIALYDAFYQVTMPSENATTDDRYRIRFYVSGVFGALDAWIRGGYRESPEEMEELFRKILTQFEKE